MIEGYPENSAVFELVGDELVGHIFASFGFFRIERQADGSYLGQHVDQSVFPEGPDTVLSLPEPAGRALADDRVSTRADNGSVIDVLVAYTGEAETGFGGEIRALAAIDLIVAETNQAFRTSLRFRHRRTVRR